LIAILLSNTLVSNTLDKNPLGEGF
jgi:hypothetical protein